MAAILPPHPRGGRQLECLHSHPAKGNPMDFDFDVFVSYAHLDDTAPAEEKKGWVARLHETLEWRLAQLLGKPARIWRDPKLHGNDVFADMLVERVHHAAILLSVVSPRYCKS